MRAREEGRGNAHTYDAGRGERRWRSGPSGGLGEVGDAKGGTEGKEGGGGGRRRAKDARWGGDSPAQARTGQQGEESCPEAVCGVDQR